jgi:pimeloyl-ACP methyl ester carboxylesterase
VVRGANTDTLSPQVARKMVQIIPNAQLVEVQRAGHMVFEDNPEDFIAALKRFLG